MIRTPDRSSASVKRLMWRMETETETGSGAR